MKHIYSIGEEYCTLYIERMSKWRGMLYIAYLSCRELYLQCTNLSREGCSSCHTDAKGEYCCTFYTYPSTVERGTNIEMTYAVLGILILTVRDDIHSVLIVMLYKRYRSQQSRVLFTAYNSQ